MHLLPAYQPRSFSHSSHQEHSTIVAASLLHCMAANSKGRAIAGVVGKRLVNQILLSPGGRAIPLSASRRNVHASTYDKNIEDHVRPTVVPDYVINTNSDKYWGPHPNTGVFGPANSTGSTGGATDQYQTAKATSSVLDEKVWFRFSEDSIY